MPRDCRIRPDGTMLIQSGDMAGASYSQFLSQKIYRALMLMDPSVVTGWSLLSVSETKTALMQYFHEVFGADSDISVEGFTVELTDSQSGADIGIRVDYKGKAPDGTPVEIIQGTRYSLSSGAIKSVDFGPSWLRWIENPHVENVLHRFSVSNASREVELPLRPKTVSNSPDEFTGASYMALLPGSFAGTLTESEKSFSFTTSVTRLIYPISRYISGFNERSESVVGATISEGDDYVTVQKVDGVWSLVLSQPVEMLITGQAKTVNALQTSYDFILRDTIARDPVYPLAQTCGKYIAIFPRTIPAGEYMIQYTGVREA